MALINASGNAVASSTASGGVTAVFHFAATFAGSSAGAGTLGLFQLSSGQAFGSSTAFWDALTDGAGVAAGSSVASGSTTSILNGRGRVLGTSSMAYSQPFTARGSSAMSAAVQVERVSPPINSATTPPKTFKWLQLLQKGDLGVLITEYGDPVIPVYISFRMLQVRSDGSRQPVGPQSRTPVRCNNFGWFYATGLAGEGGQPGNFVIEWRFQKSTGYPVYVAEQEYRVHDAVLAQNPRSLLDRKVKFGWN